MVKTVIEAKEKARSPVRRLVHNNQARDGVGLRGTRNMRIAIEKVRSDSDTGTFWMYGQQG